MRARDILIPGLACLLSATLGLPAAAQEKDLAAAYNASGQSLFRQFVAGTGNIVFSPYSIGTAMAMALAGARGNTETEMASVLKHKMPRPEIDAANAKLLAILNGYDKSAVPPRCPPNMRLEGERCVRVQEGNECKRPTRLDGMECVAMPVRVPWVKVLAANAIVMPKPTDEISFPYVDMLRSNYAAEVYRGVGLDAINGWVKQKTEGKIDKILDRLDPSSPAVLLNAVYFKAAWERSFDKRATIDGTFNLSPGQPAKVPTMRRLGGYALVERYNYRALRIPYGLKSIGMIIVLPNTIGGLPEVGKRMDVAELTDLFAALRKAKPKMVDLALPRFNAMFKTDLKGAFQQEGISLAFSREAADFSGMTGVPAEQKRLAIGQIQHAAMIDVQEAGTEAAAATAIEMVPTSIPMPQETFFVDRPFLFYLVDDATGAILFQGRINDPR